MNEKAIVIDREIGKRFSNCGYAWHSIGNNFVAYDIFSKDVRTVQQIIYEISKDVLFYCSPELSVYEHKILVNFFF